MDDHYEYEGISENAKTFAIDKLNENPAQVNSHIESFRRWITSMPHLTCPTDSMFLLKFLRIAKFDHMKAEKRLDNFCTFRSSSRGAPEYFDDIDMDDARVAEFLESELVTPLGRSETGELFLLMKPGGWNPDTLSISDYMTLLLRVLDILIEDEEAQIYGTRFLIDLKGFSSKAVLACSHDKKFMKQMSRILHDCYPMSSKGQIFYNEPVIFDVLFGMYAFFMNDKMKGRVLRVQHDIHKAMDKIPGLEDILPTEYGGKSGPMAACTEKWHKKFKEYYKNGHPLTSISVDESKRPHETLGYLTEYNECEGPTLGLDGAYTKFDNVF